MEQKNQKKFLVLKVIEFELGTTNSLDLQKDTCHWQSMCHKTHLRFNISLTQICFKSSSLRIIKTYDESALIKIVQEFGTL